MPSTDPSTPRNDGDLYHEEDANGNIKETMTYTKGDPAPASDVPAQRVVVKALALVGLAFLGIILLPLLVALAGLLLGLALGLAQAVIFVFFLALPFYAALLLLDLLVGTHCATDLTHSITRAWRVCRIWCSEGLAHAKEIAHRITPKF